MLKLDSFITKEDRIFYVDLDGYNEQTDVKFGDGDMVRFVFDDVKYIGTIVNNGGGKLGIYQIEKIKKIS
jgi:hypothetical protein